MWERWKKGESHKSIGYSYGISANEARLIITKYHKNYLSTRETK